MIYLTGYVLIKYLRKIDEKEYSVKSNCSANLLVSIKGRLKNHADYWENVIRVNTVVTFVIKECYKIPFTYTP